MYSVAGLERCVREKGRLLITGRPGVGKSTLFSSIVREAASRGCHVGGFSAPEVRSRGRRIAFKIVALDTNEEGFLAKVGSGGGPRIGRYTVVVPDVLRVAVPALKRALESADIIAIDEVGPMELLVPELREAILSAAGSEKPLIAVYHKRLRSYDPEVYNALILRGCNVEVTEVNRDSLRRAASAISGALVEAAGCS